MKNLLFVSAFSAMMLAAGCSSENENNFGEKIDEQGAITVKELETKLAQSNAPVEAKVTGKVKEVCKNEGCWLTMDMGNEKELMVRMKDHEFFVPKDIDGKTVVVEGEAYMDTTSVEDLKHYAEDAGKSKEEIDAIIQPEVEPVFEAVGVIVK
jgi:hypothetical protein